MMDTPKHSTYCGLCCRFCSNMSRVPKLSAFYPNLIADGRRLKRIGIEAWIDEQEQRRETGFCLSDIHCLPGKDGMLI